MRGGKATVLEERGKKATVIGERPRTYGGDEGQGLGMMIVTRRRQQYTSDVMDLMEMMDDSVCDACDKSDSADGKKPRRGGE